MKRYILAGAIATVGLIGSMGSVSAAGHHPNHGNKAAAHSCAHGTKADRDARGDCVSKAAKAK
jgi:hypothetical protein